jgi:hypothetical protein
MKKYLLSFFILLSLSLSAHNFETLLKEQWDLFSSQNPNLKQLTSVQVATLANQWGKETAQKLQTTDVVREIDPAVVESLLPLSGNVQVFMRHGEQQKSDRVKALPPEEQKLEMTRLPDNLVNSLTKGSVAEWMESMIVWDYLKQKSGSLAVESSKNERARLPAATLAFALKTKLQLSEVLNCVNYPGEEQISPRELLKMLPDGTLPWDQNKVDCVIGQGTYDRITQEMQDLLTCKTRTIYITHTQQINAVSSLLDLPVTRLGNFGFVVVIEGKGKLFSDGFYKKKI